MDSGGGGGGAATGIVFCSFSFSSPSSSFSSCSFSPPFLVTSTDEEASSGMIDEDNPGDGGSCGGGCDTSGESGTVSGIRPEEDGSVWDGGSKMLFAYRLLLMYAPFLFSSMRRLRWTSICDMPTIMSPIASTF